MRRENKYRVNVLHRGKKRFKYCRTLVKAKQIQESQLPENPSATIYEKVNNEYKPLSL